MPGMSGRMSTVIKAKISRLLDRAEDPGETLDYSYQRQLESLQNVKKGIADVVTAAVDRMTFLQPVHVGDLLTLQASVNAVWRTSMEVGVRVLAESPRTGEVRHTNSAYITMVAVDEHGRPVPGVPGLKCESPEELRRKREAQVRRANRLAEREELRRHREHEQEPDLRPA